jgi:phospholipid transport system substrate-binding protein
MYIVRNAMLVFMLVFAFVSPVTSHAEEGPQALVERISQTVLKQARADPEIQRGNRQRILALVQKEVLPHVDFERMTALAADRHWLDATERQKKQLSEEFSRLLIHVYSGAISQVKDKVLVFRPLRGDPSGGTVEVRSEVRQKRGTQPIELNYRLAREPSGWRIYDVSVLDVWLVQSYRSSFALEIATGGIDGLIDSLATKNKKLESAVSTSGG